MIDPKTPCRIHVVSHTHWDREWRYALQRSKNKLIGCMDKVLETLENDPDYNHFMCDGQMIMVLDYLDYRPENTQRVKKLAEKGALVLGPWYSLIDEYHSGGEAIIRNLLWGQKTAKQLGGGQDIGYCPASFGHISQMPQILAGFGFDTAMFSRGLTSKEMPDMEYIWQGADGTQVLGVHMHESYTKSNFTLAVYRYAVVGVDPQNGCPQINNMNGTPFHLCDKDCTKTAFFHELNPAYSIDGKTGHDLTLKLKEEMAERCTVPVILFFDGVDQMEANPLVTKLIAEVNKRLTNGDELIHSSLPKFFDEVKKAVKDKNLRTIEGEIYYPFFRHGGNGLYPNVSSARMYQHALNERCEVKLHKWAEPMATLASLCGNDYPQKPLDAAWKFLFANHTHDCIAGCAADDVHKNVLYRYAQIAEISEDILERSLANLSLQVDLYDIQKDEIPVIVYNCLTFDRDEVITAAIDFPADKWVGDFTIYDGGKEIPFQTTTRDEVWKLLLKWGDVSTGVPLQRFFVTFRVNDIPAMGYKTLRVKFTEGQKNGGHVYKDKLTRKYPGSIVTAGNTMENEHLRVEFNANDTFTLTDKDNNQAYTDMHFFESNPEVGEIWSPITPGHILGATNTLANSARIELLRNGPIEAAYKVDLEMMLPEYTDRQRQVPSENLVQMKITSEVILRKGSRRVDITTHFTNTAKDHLLNAVFPSDVKADKSYSAGQFNVLERPIERQHRPDWWEPHPLNYPNTGFADVSDSKRGLALLSEGINAYQVRNDARRSMTLTLCRATVCPVSMSPDETGSQCLRDHEYRYAVYPHKGDWQKAKVFNQSIAHNAGLHVIETGPHTGILPKNMSFVKITPDDIVISALKPAEAAGGTILRFFNPTAKSIKAKAVFYKGVKTADVTDMKEEKIIRELNPDGNSVSIDVEPKKIITLRFTLEE